MLNMYVSAAILGLAGAAAASAAAAVPVYPETQISKGFRLVVNVTDRSKDFHPSIHNTYITHLHDGRQPHRELVGQAQDKHKSMLFYLNGTDTDHFNNQVLTESLGDFTTGLGLNFEDHSENLRTARLVLGGGDAYFSLIHYGEHMPFLRPERWVACKEKLPRYPLDEEDIVFKQAVATRDPISLRYEYHIPGNCVYVTLLPECAKLNDLPKPSKEISKNIVPSHEHVVDAHCYPNVKKIDWSKFASD